MKETYKKLVLFEDIFRKLKGQYDLDPYWNHYLESREPEYFSFFQMREIWEKFIAESKKEKTLKYIKFFYLNVPFCMNNKCSYCMYPSSLIKDAKEADPYIRYLFKFFDFFQHTFEPVIFDDVFLGGGSVSLSTPKQINELLSGLFGRFHFRENQERTFEFHPQDVTPGKLKLIKEFGFNRVSLGVQSLDEDVLKLNCRDNQTYETVKSAAALAEKIGFREIGVHLMCGLGGDTPQSFLKSFEGVAKLGPQKITIYKLRPVENYLERYFGAKTDVGKMAYHKNFVREAGFILGRIQSIARKFGYKNITALNPLSFDWIFMRSDYKKPDDFENRYGSKRPLFESAPFSCFGAGFYARSHIANNLLYKHIGGSHRFDCDEKVFEGRKLSKKDEMKKFIISSLNVDFKIPLKEFKEIFNCSIQDVFGREIEALEHFKKIKTEGDFLYFLPNDSKERVIYPLFFVYND